MVMIHEGPYTNLHDLNIDWILQVVKEFLDKYTDVDGFFQGLYDSLTALSDEESERLQTQTDNAVTSINNTKTSALEELLTQYTLYLQQLNTAKTNAIEAVEETASQYPPANTMVSVNQDQNFSNTQKAQGRENINAITYIDFDTEDNNTGFTISY